MQNIFALITFSQENCGLQTRHVYEPTSFTWSIKWQKSYLSYENVCENCKTRISL